MRLGRSPIFPQSVFKQKYAGHIKSLLLGNLQLNIHLRNPTNNKMFKDTKKLLNVLNVFKVDNKDTRARIIDLILLFLLLILNTLSIFLWC